VAKISAQSTATVALAVSSSPSQAGQAVTLTATVTPTQTYASVPTGTIEFQDESTLLSTVALNASGVATYATSSLTPNTHSLTAVYSGDSTYPTGSGSASLTITGLSATVKVTPAASSVSTASSLSVKVTVTGSGATPTGTVTLSGGGYSSTPATLVSGIVTIIIPANSLSVGADTLSVSYSGDASFGPATGTAPVTVTPAPLIPTVKVTPAATTLDSGSTLSVPVAVTGTGATPTGTVTLSGGGYTSTPGTLVAGDFTFTIPANSLSVGTDTLTVSYSGDASYASGTETAPVTVTESVYTLAASTPAAVSPGSSTTLTVTVSTPSGYAGTITLDCALTSSPRGATDPPVCTGGTVTLGGTITTGTATIKVTTTSASSSALAWPKVGGKGRSWSGAGGGAVLAFLLFLGIPARRRSWRSMLGVLLLMASVGSLTACGGHNTSNPGTTAGSYTFTVTGTGSPSVTPAPTTTFTLTVN
jgi:hypothetical protein